MYRLFLAYCHCLNSRTGSIRYESFEKADKQFYAGPTTKPQQNMASKAATHYILS